MKLITIFITAVLSLICMHGSAASQEMIAKAYVSESRNVQTVASEFAEDTHQQGASRASLSNPIVELKALYAKPQFTEVPGLFTSAKQAAHQEANLVEEWRERIFNTLRLQQADLYQKDIMDDSRLKSNDELDKQVNERRMVASAVLKESLKFAQEKIEIIDILVKILKCEVSTDTLYRKHDEDQANDEKRGDARMAVKKAVKERLFVKTGLRVPLESGKPGVVSETEAKYGKMTSFIKVKLDGQYDNSVGLTYALGNGMRLEAVREEIHGAVDPLNGESVRANRNIVRLTYVF